MKHLTHSALILVVCFTITFIACEKDPAAVPDANQINFQAPEAGQENYYLVYNGECGELMPTGDTLILRVKDIIGEEVQFEEVFSEGSPSHSHHAIVFPAKWNTDMIEIKPEFRQQSRLFFFYGDDFLKLNQPPTVSLTQNDCVLWNGQTSFRGEMIGTISKFQVGEHLYQKKNIVSCVPTILELDAYLVYDKHTLYSSFSINKWEFWGNLNQNVSAYTLVDIDNQ